MARFEGFDVDESELYPGLFPHQKMLVKWAVQGGNRGLFASFGMGKSVMQCEWLRIIIEKAGGAGHVVAGWRGGKQVCFGDMCGVCT